jgi:hypothetical protein
MIISLFMGAPVEFRRSHGAAGAHVEARGRECGSQPDGQRQPHVVNHRRNSKKKIVNRGSV